MNTHMSVAMKLVTTTKRNQLVPGNLAGEAHAMQMMPKSWKRKDKSQQMIDLNLEP